MGSTLNDSLVQFETTCGSLLYELQVIWDEVGESETDKDKMLYELEQECLEVYRRKVDQANRCRAQLRQAIAESEAELAAICSAMGERPVHTRQTEQKDRSLKEELCAILPLVEDMRKRKQERKQQFLDVIRQIQKISIELYGLAENSNTKTAMDDSDLSLRRLEDFQRELQSLQNEKNDRLKQVIEHLNVLSSLCCVLGLDFKKTVQELHPSLGDSEETHSISTDTLQQLEVAIKKLRELKLQRMKRLQDLGTMLLELWNLMDIPLEEQQSYQNVTCHIAASEDEIIEPNLVSEELIKYVEVEVFRLEALKSSKMKELVLKKRSELKEICRKTHLIPEADGEIEYVLPAIESGALDPAFVLEQIELEVARVKEEAFSRKEILEKVEKWLSAREEEEWLEHYNMDENRYNAGRGAHISLKRAEKARTLINKLPGMVEALAAKTLNWENERGAEFMYDGIRLLSMLEEYVVFREEKEQEKKRQREQKKLQGQLMAEQEVLFGSKPSPVKSAKKARRMSMGGGSNRRLSVVGNMLQTPKPDLAQPVKTTPNSRSTKEDKTPTLSTARRGLAISSIPVINHTLNGQESVPKVIRKPFSPISSKPSLKANADIFDDHNDLYNNEQILKTPQKIVTGNVPFTTPLKMVTAASEENQSPSMMSIHVSRLPIGGNSMQKKTTEEIEYSFEERRAGFVLPITPIKRAT